MASLLKKAFGLSGVDGNPSNQPPLHGLRVVEFAGLAPGPLVGLILADFGADVIRIDKVGASINPDGLARGKRSISVDPKTADGLETLRRLVEKADVVIDPFRPGVLERLGLGPEEAARSNQRVIFARLTGFQRQGECELMAFRRGDKLLNRGRPRRPVRQHGRPRHQLHCIERSPLDAG